jgi:predicted DNA binding CopG/RHH family protein
MTEPPEKPKKEKKNKGQVHLRLEEELVNALEAQAEKEGITITALVKKYMRQGLGLDEESPKANIDIAEIEERVLKRVSECVSQIDEAALEERVLKRVSERVSQEWISYSATLEAKIHESVSTRISDLEAASFEQPPTSNDNSVSPSDTDRYTENLEQTKPSEESAVIPINEENALAGPMPLIGSISDGQVITVPELVKYLNQVVNSNPKISWTREKLRSQKKKLLTYLKKPLDKRESAPPCPFVINGYMVDWIFAEDEPINSYGRQWWIQHLPKNPDEAEKLIQARRDQWKSHH